MRRRPQFYPPSGERFFASLVFLFVVVNLTLGIFCGMITYAERDETGAFL